jgi:hypothetical protein
MGISIKILLDRYFSLPELQDALDWIGEPVSGTKAILINRTVSTWGSHNRDLGDLLDILYPDQLRLICQDYNLNTKGGKSILVERIVNSRVVEGFGHKNSGDSEEVRVSDRPMRRMWWNETDGHGLIKLIVRNKKLQVVLVGIVSAVVIATTIAADFVTIVSFWHH